MRKRLPLPAILVSQWHPTRNPTLDIHDIASTSLKMVWWLCPVGSKHEWETSMKSRNGKHRISGCPFCSNNRVLSGFNDFATTHPNLISEWHPTKNLPLTPEQVLAGSHLPVTWKCEKEGHVWEAVLNKRTSRGDSCVYCSNQRMLVGCNDLATTHPQLAAEWHSTRNLPLTPETVINAGLHKISWQCLKNEKHIWETTIGHRKSGQNCPYCSNQKLLVGDNDFGTTHPELAKEWHPTRNGTLTPQDVFKGMSKKVWWVGTCNHEWDALLADKGRFGCPKCPRQISKAERSMLDHLTSLGVVVQQSDRTVLKSHEIDLYIPASRIGIEYNGLYWHSEGNGRNGRAKNYHYDKWLEAKDAGVQLIQVWEDDWQRNPELVKSMLSYKLGVNVGQKIFARKTQVVELKTVDAKAFLGQYHIQGFASGSHYVGLADAQGVLRALMVLKKEADNTLNIVRYATSGSVVGGFTKLLAYATKTFQPDSFITFADHTISDGGLYENNGFVVDKKLPPDYMYVVKGQRKHKFGYRLKRFRNDPDLLWEDGLTERELAVLNNIPRIWDAGKTRYRLVVKT